MTDATPPKPSSSGPEGPGAPAEADVVDAPIWDAPTRLFKWSLAVAVAVGWALGDNMTFTNAETHKYVGYAVGALVVFRLIWGLIGPRPSRLIPLAAGPGAVLRYARGLFKAEPSYWPGHNPMGGLWVLAVLLVLAAQVATGLMATSDVFFTSGPLASTVGPELSALATSWHIRLQNVLLALVALHVFMVLYYFVYKGEDLISPMVHGVKKIRRRADQDDAGPTDA